ncbi:MAG: hypothetical protein QOK28_1710 [Actinomycetota bacterium]|jgi:hypothetical protein
MTPHPSKGENEDDRDQIVLELRSTGRSFAFIARTLNLGKPRDANAAFLRAIKQSPARDRKRLRDEEMVRLQQLEDTIRGNDELAPFDLDRQLETLKHLRSQLKA